MILFYSNCKIIIVIMRTLLLLNELESDFTIIIFQTSHVSTSEVKLLCLCTLTDSKSYTK